LAAAKQALGEAGERYVAKRCDHGLAKWSGHSYNKDEDRHGLGYTAFIGLLVAAHQELVAAQQEKDARIAGLEEQLAQLGSRLARLEGLLSR